MTEALLEAVIQGIAVGALSPPEAAHLEHPSINPDAIDARKRRDKRLTGWRDSEARKRGVHEQVVLPGHCVRQLATGKLRTAPEIAALEGLGKARGERYAAELAKLLDQDSEA